MSSFYSDHATIPGDRLVVKYKLLHPDAQVPQPAHGYSEDAGADLRSVEHYTLKNGETKAISTGVSFELPPGFEAQVRSRSGLALKGIVVAHGVGTIDPSYRGEVKAILFNRSGNDFVISPGDRVAQVVIAKYEAASWHPAELSESERGTGGYGSTGK